MKGKLKRILTGVINVIRLELRRDGKEKVINTFNGHKDLCEYVETKDGGMKVVRIYEIDTIDNITFVVTGSQEIIYENED